MSWSLVFSSLCIAKLIIHWHHFNNAATTTTYNNGTWIIGKAWPPKKWISQEGPDHAAITINLRILCSKPTEVHIHSCSMCITGQPGLCSLSSTLRARRGSITGITVARASEPAYPASYKQSIPKVTRWLPSTHPLWWCQVGSGLKALVVNYVIFLVTFKNTHYRILIGNKFKYTYRVVSHTSSRAALTNILCYPIIRWVSKPRGINFLCMFSLWSYLMADVAWNGFLNFCHLFEKKKQL